jgi:hypothetical protein
MASEKDMLVSRIFLRALLPVLKVALNDNPKMLKKFNTTTATIQFAAKDASGDVGAYLDFADGALEIRQGVLQNPDIAFMFNSVAKMNAMFAGKPVLPKIKGIYKIRLFLRIISLFLSLKVLEPDAKPKDPLKRRLKVKMTIYMVTTALSQYNKGRDPEMMAWTSKQPERIYQMSVIGEPDIAAYMKVKAGKSKAGRGFYKKRRPFVHMRFNGIDGAIPILLNEINMVEAVRDGVLVTEGSPEYARDIGNFMMRIQELIM